MLLGNCVLFSLLFSFLVPVAYWLVIKPFHATDLFWYPQKTSENQRGYQKRSVAGNGLMKKKWVIQNKWANKKLNAKLFFCWMFFLRTSIFRHKRLRIFKRLSMKETFFLTKFCFCLFISFKELTFLFQFHTYFRDICSSW